ncbi:hypothetical protein ALMP_80210 [Streptomyces sp. A012304]|nr:hypothetical protein ALMP_80210 [Streptomyces sp. A012304]
MCDEDHHWRERSQEPRTIGRNRASGAGAGPPSTEAPDRHHLQLPTVRGKLEAFATHGRAGRGNRRRSPRQGAVPHALRSPHAAEAAITLVAHTLRTAPHRLA